MSVSGKDPDAQGPSPLDVALARIRDLEAALVKMCAYANFMPDDVAELIRTSASETEAKCQHDLQAPFPTITVEDQVATCHACGYVWNPPL
jgi:hypothetical protein